tara:strand:- start:48791 stop:49387 length:597 start_codon:yes stop_codon:yes gene_type:complete
MQLIVGIDEVGRGPLAGAVVAAAVILDPQNPIEGLTDSKILSAKKREVLFDVIKEKAKAWALGRAEVHEIDEINIHHASLLAMKRAYEALNLKANKALIDGKFCPDIDCESEAIIKGDLTEPAISAASILAKVTRDREMTEYDKQYPHYGFAKHAGYPTKQHMQAIENHGICILHRRSYKPVRLYLESHSEALSATNM